MVHTMPVLHGIKDRMDLHVSPGAQWSGFPSGRMISIFQWMEV